MVPEYRTPHPLAGRKVKKETHPWPPLHPLRSTMTLSSHSVLPMSMLLSRAWRTGATSGAAAAATSMAGVTPISEMGVRWIPPTIFSPVAPRTLRGGADGGRCRAESAVTLAEIDTEAEWTDGGRASVGEGPPYSETWWSLYGRGV